MLARGAELPDAYLRVFLTTDGPVPGIAERVRDALANVVDVGLRYEQQPPTTDGTPLSTLQPRDQFVSYYRSEHGVPEVPGELLSAFDEVLDDVGQEA